MWRSASSDERPDHFVVIGAPGSHRVELFQAALNQLRLPEAQVVSYLDLLSGMRVASQRYDSSFAVEAIEVRTLTESGGNWTIGPATDLTRGDVISAVASLPGGQLMMVHPGGVLIVQE